MNKRKSPYGSEQREDRPAVLPSSDSLATDNSLKTPWSTETRNPPAMQLAARQRRHLLWVAFAWYARCGAAVLLVSALLYSAFGQEMHGTLPSKWISNHLLAHQLIYLAGLSGAAVGLRRELAGGTIMIAAAVVMTVHGFWDDLCLIGLSPPFYAPLAVRLPLFYYGALLITCGIGRGVIGYRQAASANASPPGSHCIRVMIVSGAVAVVLFCALGMILFTPWQWGNDLQAGATSIGIPPLGFYRCNAAAPYLLCLWNAALLGVPFAAVAAVGAGCGWAGWRLRHIPTPSSHASLSTRAVIRKSPI